MNEPGTQQNMTSRKEHRFPAWRIAILCSLAAVVILAGIRLYHASGGVHFDEEFAAQTYDGMTTYYLNSSNHSNVSVVYLHDQDDTDSASSNRRWRLLNRIANETDAEIITPDIASLDTAGDEEIYERLYDWYVPWQHGNDSRILYIAGDGENSPLLTGFMDYLESHGAHLPNGTASIDDITDALAESES